MKILIEEELKKYGNDISIGAITIENLNREDKCLQQKIDIYVQQKLKILKDIAQSTALSNREAYQKWKDIFAKMQVKQGKYSSIVALTDYFEQNQKIYDINELVDLYNTISLFYGIPMGGYDLDNISGNISLRLAKKGEEFTAILSKQIEKTSSGEVVYSDSKGVFCRYWNNKDSDRTKITQSTKNLLLVFDGINDEDKIIMAFNDVKFIFSDYKTSANIFSLT